MTNIAYPYRILAPSYFGKVIQSERKTQGMTQAELASWTNTSAKFISDVEQGKSTVQLDKLFDLLKALDLSVHVTKAPV